MADPTTKAQRDKDHTRTDPALTVAGTTTAAAGIGAGISGSGNPGPATGAGSSGTMGDDERRLGYGAPDRRADHDETLARATSVLGQSSHDEPDALGSSGHLDGHEPRRMARTQGGSWLDSFGGTGWGPRVLGAGLALWGLRRGGVLGLAGMAVGGTMIARAIGWTARR